MKIEKGTCPRCGSGKRRQALEQAVKKSLQPKSLAAMIRQRLRQPVQVKKPNGSRRRLRFERVVGQVWYEIDGKYVIERAANGTTTYVEKPADRADGDVE